MEKKLFVLFALIVLVGCKNESINSKLETGEIKTMNTKIQKQDKQEYVVGQVWNYDTRESESESKLKIIAIDQHEKLGTIISVTIDGVLLGSQPPNGIHTEMSQIGHMPFSKEAMDISVLEISEIDNVENDMEGYELWKNALKDNNAGIYTISVKEAIDALEEMIQ